ncbi:MAG: hypothetical protein NC122_00265 [Faecalibacterium sp.]|nr:hypothetical protein [Ruminococcus flavefaciens]MCM1363233.1 hypothetical protein [Clostridiales bacterium]MCM1484624.1 hypothetical protein [Faecalibacterium sp.]
MSKYAKEDLTQILYDAMVCFNEKMKFNISPDNTVLAFFTPDNGIEVYETFCQQYFPNWLNEDYMTEGYFESFAASAFVGEKYGILIRLDLDMTAAEWFEIFLHEISHIYCSVNEIDGGYFFDRFCNGSKGVEDGIMNAGYAIWREAIADIMAHELNPYSGMYIVQYVKPHVDELYRSLSYKNPDSKKAMSLILAYLMLTNEIRQSENWQQAEIQIRKVMKFDDEMIYRIVELVYENLRKSEYWRITSDFIMNIGEAYLWLLTNKSIKSYE